MIEDVRIIKSISLERINEILKDFCQPESLSHYRNKIIPWLLKPNGKPVRMKDIYNDI